MLQLVMFNLLSSLKRLMGDQRGISAIEYAVLAAVILVAVAAALATFGGNFEGWFSTAADAVDGALGGGDADPDPEP